MAKFSRSLKMRYPDFPYAAVEDGMRRAKAVMIGVSRASDVSPEAKIPFKTRTILHCALRRNCEICDAFIRSFNVELYTPLSILARSSIETGALAHDIWTKTESIIDANDTTLLDDYDARLMNVLLGGKSDAAPSAGDEYSALNVLTIIDRLSNTDLPPLRDAYDHLSELAHPNYSGMLEAYTEPDLENRETRFIDDPFDRLAPLTHLPVHSVAVGLGLAVAAVEQCEARMGDFATLCERAIYESGTWPSYRPYPVAR